MRHQLRAIGTSTPLGQRTAYAWLFICTCGATFSRPQRRATYTEFAVHAHFENKEDTLS